eukprot:3058213-Prymnesium_polylepis.1
MVSRHSHSCIHRCVLSSGCACHQVAMHACERLNDAPFARLPPYLCSVLVHGEPVCAIEILCMPASGCGLAPLALLNL